MNYERVVERAIDQVISLYCVNNPHLKLQTLTYEREKLKQYFLKRKGQTKQNQIEEILKYQSAYFLKWMNFYKISGMSLAVGLEKGPELYFYLGHGGEQDFPIDQTVLFDIASVSKMFTDIHAIMDHKFGFIALDQPIHQINSDFHYACTITELLNFYYQLETHPRIDDSNITLLEAEKALRLATTEQIGVHTYSDIPHMIYSRLSPDFKEHFRLYFNIIMGLYNTGYEVDENALLTGNDYHYPRQVRDEKARVCEYSGHAGIWSTSKDLVQFFQFLIRENLVTKQDLKILTTLLTDDNYPRAMLYRQTGGGLYRNSEIPYISSENAFAASGSTGSWVLMDLENGYTANILTNPYSSKHGIPNRYSNKLNDLKVNLLDVIRKLQVIVKINELEEQKEFLRKKYVLK